MIEALESRIAPASLVLMDLDGDKITITTSKGDQPPLTLLNFGGSSALIDIDLSDPEFNGTNLTVSVAKGKVAGVPGDGLVLINSIGGGTNDFGTIKIAGDLVHIDAGSGNPLIPAIKSLAVNSYGRFAESSSATSKSQINGSVGALMVKGNFQVTNFFVTGNLGSVTIGGSVIGGALAEEGQIYASGDVGKVAIKKDLRGGAGASTGIIAAGHNLGPVSIGGSIYGGAGNHSGDVTAAFVSAGEMTKVTVGGSVFGGTGNKSGQIGHLFVGETAKRLDIGTITIGGDLVGGAGPDSGVITATAGGTVQKLTIKGNLVGGTAGSAGSVQVAGNIGTFTLGGSLYGGTTSATGSIAAGHIDTVSIGGSIFGGSGQSSGRISTTGTGIDLLKIRGDVWGSTGTNSGQVLTGGQIDKTLIGGFVIPGSGANSGTVN